MFDRIYRNNLNNMQQTDDTVLKTDGKRKLQELLDKVMKEMKEKDNGQQQEASYKL